MFLVNSVPTNAKRAFGVDLVGTICLSDGCENSLPIYVTGPKPPSVSSVSSAYSAIQTKRVTKLYTPTTEKTCNFSLL